MKAIHPNDWLRMQGLPGSPFAEPRSGLRAVFSLLAEGLRLTLALGVAAVVLAFRLLVCREERE